MPRKRSTSSRRRATPTLRSASWHPTRSPSTRGGRSWPAPRPVAAACGAGSRPGRSRPENRLGSLSARSGRLYDAAGREVRLTGVNWFGLETPNFAPHGLWARNWGEMLDQIAASGFNSLRLPFSNQLFERDSRPNSIDLSKNPDLDGLNGLQLLDRIIGGAAS